MKTEEIRKKLNPFITKMRYALDRFNWEASSLDADALSTLNTWEKELTQSHIELAIEVLIEELEYVDKEWKTNEDLGYADGNSQSATYLVKASVYEKEQKRLMKKITSLKQELMSNGNDK